MRKAEAPACDRGLDGWHRCLLGGVGAWAPTRPNLQMQSVEDGSSPAALAHLAIICFRSRPSAASNSDDIAGNFRLVQLLAIPGDSCNDWPLSLISRLNV